MHWWEETEARVNRTKSAAAVAQTLWQRLQAAGIEAGAGLLAAYDLARLQELCSDLVRLVDGLLLIADGDRAALRRHGLVLARWAQAAEAWCQTTAPAFNQLLNGLDLDQERLSEREEVEPASGETAGPPEEQAKLDGRYRHWHLLYERLDLKLASMGLGESVQRGLARLLARLYEECLVTFRLLSGLEKEANPRFRATANLLLQINTTWHFDLGPYHLGAGHFRSEGAGSVGLQTWLLLMEQDT